MGSSTLGLMMVLLAVASVPGVDVLAVTPEWAASSTSGPKLRAAAPGTCTPAAAPSPKAPEHSCTWASKSMSELGFIFSSIGMMGQAIPWFVFSRMTAVDWTKQQFDSYSEWTLMFSVLSCFATLVLHLVFIAKRNMDTILAGFAGVCFGMQQMNHVQCKKREADLEYAKATRNAIGRTALVWFFWLFLICQIVVFYFLQHPPPISESVASTGFIVLFTIIAIMMQGAAVIFPFIDRCCKNNWEKDSRASREGKFIEAIIQVVSSGFDSYNYGCNELYWSSEQGLVGQRVAMILACTSTCCGILLFFARLIGPANFKEFWLFLRRTQDIVSDEESPPMDAAAGQENAIQEHNLIHMHEKAAEESHGKDMETRLKEQEQTNQLLEAKIEEQNLKIMHQETEKSLHKDMEMLLKQFQDSQNLLQGKIEEQEQQMQNILEGHSKRQHQFDVSIADLKQTVHNQQQQIKSLEIDYQNEMKTKDEGEDGPSRADRPAAAADSG